MFVKLVQKDSSELIATLNVLYRCTDKTVSLLATVLPKPVIMSTDVNDRQKVLINFFFVIIDLN